MMEKAYEKQGKDEVWNEKLLTAAINWITDNPDLKPSFSTACGMVFTDNSAADDFDIDLGGFAHANNIELDGKYIPFLFFAAEEEVTRRNGAPTA